MVAASHSSIKCNFVSGAKVTNVQEVCSHYQKLVPWLGVPWIIMGPLPGAVN